MSDIQYMYLGYLLLPVHMYLVPIHYLCGTRLEDHGITSL